MGFYFVKILFGTKIRTKKRKSSIIIITIIMP